MSNTTYDQYEKQALALLAPRSTEDLKADYREALRGQETDPDASEARRLITIELLRRLTREDVAEFEEYERELARGTCPVCHDPLTDHVGARPCIACKPSGAKSLYNLPIWGEFWKADAREVER